MIQTLASLLNEKLVQALNQMLTDCLDQKDTAMLRQLPLLIEVTDIQVRLLLRCQDRSIVIQQCQADDPIQSGVQISGSSLVLMQLATADDKQQVIVSKSGLHISGDTAALYTWQRTFKGLSLNWEGELNQKLGAIAASILISLLHTLRNKAKEVNQTLPSSLHHTMVSNDLAVDNCDFAAHAKEVQHTRLATDNLRRKIDKLLATRSQRNAQAGNSVA